MTSSLSCNLSTTMGDLNSKTCAWRESNPLPCGPEPHALSDELQARVGSVYPEVRHEFDAGDAPWGRRAARLFWPPGVPDGFGWWFTCRPFSAGGRIHRSPTSPAARPERGTQSRPP